MGYRLGSVDGRAVLVEGDNYFDLQSATDGGFSSDPMAALARTNELAEVTLNSAEPAGEVSGATFGPPTPRPSKVFGIGLNYTAHAAESNLEVPDSPVVFTKFPSCLTGPTGEVELRGERCSWEAELVVVIGSGGRDIGRLLELQVPETRDARLTAGECGHRGEGRDEIGLVLQRHFDGPEVTSGHGPLRSGHAHTAPHALEQMCEARVSLQVISEADHVYSAPRDRRRGLIERRGGGVALHREGSPA